jgi:hypothetical protein
VAKGAHSDKATSSHFSQTALKRALRANAEGRPYEESKIEFASVDAQMGEAMCTLNGLVRIVPTIPNGECPGLSQKKVRSQRKWSPNIDDHVVIRRSLSSTNGIEAKLSAQQYRMTRTESVGYSNIVELLNDQAEIAQPKSRNKDQINYKLAHSKGVQAKTGLEYTLPINATFWQLIRTAPRNQLFDFTGSDASGRRR